MKRIVIAAPHSGSGKTTVTLGIMAALKRRGLAVAPFKVGPDFIDPGYHRLATGTTSVNLDGWICGAGFIRDTFLRHAGGSDVAVVEGVMGLFDGIDGVSEAGSTAQMAKLLAAPVLLVVDARSQARSAAALVHGFASFDPELKMSGVVFNNVASVNHEQVLREAMTAALPGVPVIGCLPKDPALAIPSRHLGLLTVEDNPLSDEFLAHLADVMERHLDLDRLLAFRPVKLKSRISESKSHRAGSGFPSPSGGGSGRGNRRCSGFHRSFKDKAGDDGGIAFPRPLAPSREGRGELNEERLPSGRGDSLSGPLLSGRGDSLSGPLPFKGRDRVGMGSSDPAPVRIAVARDASFCFVYEDNLRLLREEGAELCFFSPLTDRALPEGVSGMYLPGGYPELFAGRLARNELLKEEIRRVVDAGMPVYAECGGFIYLTQGVESEEGLQRFVGLFPVQTRMLPRRKALGYREVELLADSVIGEKGSRARGHEFHYSEMEQMPDDVERLYSVSRKGAGIGLEGFRYKNCLASYIHLHFGSSPSIAETFVRHCRTFKKGSVT